MLQINHKIPTLEQCRQIAAQKPEFKEIRKGGYIVFDYNLNDSHTFDDPLALEMRGIAFLEDGTLASLPLHKFFNLGEKSDQNIVLDGSEEVMEKIDGSMIRTIKLTDSAWVFGTRAGETDVSALADKFVTFSKSTAIDALVEVCHDNNKWPIFEFWSPENAIVLKYDQPFLKLIAIRNSDGTYLSYKDMKDLADQFGVECANLVNSKFDDVVSSYRSLKDIEGFVVRTNGDWVKLKTEEYCLLHKSMDDCKFDKDVAKMVLNNMIDDVLPLLTESRRNEVLTIQSNINSYINWSVKFLEMTVDSFRQLIVNGSITRKDVALVTKNHPYRSEIFSLLDGKDAEEVLRTKVMKATGRIADWDDFSKENFK